MYWSTYFLRLLQYAATSASVECFVNRSAIDWSSFSVPGSATVASGSLFFFFFFYFSFSALSWLFWKKFTLPMLGKLLNRPFVTLLRFSSSKRVGFGLLSWISIERFRYFDRVPLATSSLLPSDCRIPTFFFSQDAIFASLPSSPGSLNTASSLSS